MFISDKDYFYQWDSNLSIGVDDDDIKEVHFCNKTDDCSLVVEVKDGRVEIPNILLTQAMPIYIYPSDGEKTLFCKKFEVKPRSKPADYIYTETEVIEWEKALGDIELALDTIIKIQNEIIGGEEPGEPENPDEPDYNTYINFEIEGYGNFETYKGYSWERFIEESNPTVEAPCCSGEYMGLLSYSYEGEEDYRVYISGHCGPPAFLKYGGTDVYFFDEVQEAYYTYEHKGG